MSELTFEKYSAEEWDHIRERFFDSILKETEIANLGQNVGISWPFKGKGETPEKYIGYELEELQSVPGLIGKKSRIKTLMDILRETLAFDDPFSVMVDAVEADGLEDNTFERILAKLEIPLNYPSEFLHFAESTKTLLKQEGAHTLIDAIHLGQKLDHDVATGRDLKDFLNGLAHKDEPGITKRLPYRRGVRGLHLPEAIGLIAVDLPAAAQLHLLAQTESGLSEEEAAAVSEANSLNIESSIKSALEQITKLGDWFADGYAELEDIFSTGGSPERYFIMINDPRRERIAVELVKLQLGVDDNKKSGFFGKLFGR